MKVRSAAVWLASAVLLGGVACGSNTEEVVDVSKPVVVSPVELHDIAESIEATGELLAKNRAEVAAQVGGEITDLLFEEGDEVENGAVVVEIDPQRHRLEFDRAQAQVGEAEAALAEADREVTRMRVLAKQKVASTTRLDQAETDAKTARSRLAAARANLGVAQRALEDSSVRARFSGRIARRHVNRGEFVAVGQNLFELVSLDPIEVEFHLPERDASRVRLEMPIEVTVTAYPGEIFRATVEMVSPTIDPRTRTLRVRALLANADGRLRPGFFARSHLGVATREDVMMVAEEAVLQRADGAVVFRVLPGNTVERLVVETGLVEDGRIEIVAGLASGDLVAERGHSELISGSAITPRNSDGTPAGLPPTASIPSEGAEVVP
ncbi:MAG: efflux RND transporter periplasmic adaptor subunit [Myxococcota bacterium]